MTLTKIHIQRDERGTTAVEFAFTAPLFFMLLAGITQFGLLLWTQLGLQHGVEMAVRCASIKATACGNATDIQTYAAQQAFGLNPPPSTFVVSNTACGTLITADYTFHFMTSYFGTPTLSIKARSCFPA